MHYGCVHLLLFGLPLNVTENSKQHCSSRAHALIQLTQACQTQCSDVDCAAADRLLVVQLYWYLARPALIAILLSAAMLCVLAVAFQHSRLEVELPLMRLHWAHFAFFMERWAVVCWYMTLCC